MSEPKKVKRPRGKVRLIPGKCIACGARCQSACKFDAIEMNEQGGPIIDLAKCTVCRQCIKVCPSDAIEVVFTPEEQKILDEMAKTKGTAKPEPEPEEQSSEEAAIAAKIQEYKGVWVYVEHTEGDVAEVSWELLGAGVNLAKTLNVELCSVVIGENTANLCQESIAYGAKKAYTIDNPQLHFYRTKPYYEALCHLVEKYKPEILLVGATGQGRDLAGAVATKLQTGLTADCTGLAIDEKGFLLQTRPAFGGNIMATILTETTRPQMSTVRPRVMMVPEKNDANKGEVISENFPCEETDFTARILEIIKEPKGADHVDVAGADIIVSGGRGMMSKENFEILHELADLLNGTVGSSRGAVESGWMPVERQVGQTGKTVRPQIYIACGISGAIQHLVGMQNSDVIIAINRDKDAPIFEVATYGIVGDVFEIVPALISRLKELRAKAEKTP